MVDASVAVKWLTREPDSATAERLRDGAWLLSAPDLLGPEVGNALWKKLRRAQITPDEASDGIALLAGVPLRLFPSTPLLASALDLALRLNRTVYDCTYLALAVDLNCALVTADRRFHAAVVATALAKHIRYIEEGV